MRSRQLKLAYAMAVALACAPITHRVLAGSSSSAIAADARGTPPAGASSAAPGPTANGASHERNAASRSHPSPRVSPARQPQRHQGTATHAGARPAPDHTGRSRTGKASFYADRFGGRKMADGTPMNLHGHNAASRTLPLGTRAVVTNLETGRSAVVTIQDRGPYVDGRIVDLSPATARDIGLTREQGLAMVQVAPITVPLPDGQVLLGDGASITAVN